MFFRKRSFTLIELVAVILVIAILAASFVVISLGSNRLIAAANKLMFDIRYAQQLAISQQVPSGVFFNISGNNYIVYNNTLTLEKAKDPYSGEDLIVDYDTDAEYKGINLVSTNFGNLISFDYLGVPKDSNNVTLSSQGTVILQFGTHSKNITIEANTGEVKIQ